MTYHPSNRTHIVPEGNRWQARYFDPELRLWFDLGDPRDTPQEALDLAATMKADAEGREGRRQRGRRRPPVRPQRPGGGPMTPADRVEADALALEFVHAAAVDAEGLEVAANAKQRAATREGWAAAKVRRVADSAFYFHRLRQAGGFVPGDRVAFPVRKCDAPATATGTVRPSRLTRFALVEVDGAFPPGFRTEVAVANLTRLES